MKADRQDGEQSLRARTLSWGTYPLAGQVEHSRSRGRQRDRSTGRPA